MCRISLSLFGRMWQSGKIRRSGVRCPVLTMCRSIGQTIFHTASVHSAVMGTWCMSHHSWSIMYLMMIIIMYPRSKVGSIAAGCCAPTGKGSQKNMCHSMDIWTLKQIPLPYLLACLPTVKPMYLLFQLKLDTP